jgi:hypothetical protein
MDLPEVVNENVIGASAKVDLSPSWTMTRAVVPRRLRDMIVGVTELVARSRLLQGDRVRSPTPSRPASSPATLDITKMEMERRVVQLDDPIGRYTDGVAKARATQLEPMLPE